MEKSAYFEDFFEKCGDIPLPTAEENLRRVELDTFIFLSNLKRSSASLFPGNGTGVALSGTGTWG